ncbi:MAG: DUF4160 domain-containing protein [Caldilineaceae bacterium]
MTEIARFYGIIIRMYPEFGERHHRPHFHAYYQEHGVTYGIDDIEEIRGELPKRQRRLVEAWAELHRIELQENWERLVRGQNAQKIDPLK